MLDLLINQHSLRLMRPMTDLNVPIIRNRNSMAKMPGVPGYNCVLDVFLGLPMFPWNRVWMELVPEGDACASFLLGIPRSGMWCDSFVPAHLYGTHLCNIDFNANQEKTLEVSRFSSLIHSSVSPSPLKVPTLGK